MQTHSLTIILLISRFSGIYSLRSIHYLLKALHTDTHFEFHLRNELMKLGIICKKHEKEIMHFEAGTIFENNNFTYVCVQIVQNDYLPKSIQYFCEFLCARLR